MKMDAAEKAKKIVEIESAENDNLALQDDGYESEYDADESDSVMKDDRKEPPRISALELDRLADVAATLPILTEDFRALCQTSPCPD